MITIRRKTKKKQSLIPFNCNCYFLGGIYLLIEKAKQFAAREGLCFVACTMKRQGCGWGIRYFTYNEKGMFEKEIEKKTSQRPS